ncbi:MAG: hypothetical protein LBU85_01255 [Treponema sp.]|jgi:hypothetical protein|nr:hypothetical protein [Treponema sp.]
METKNQQTRDRIFWHPAFFEAIQMELEEYSRELLFLPEHQLTTEPLRIDAVIIKKSGDKPIKKNIASIFRKENIVEYKSPSDYLSTADFYKVYGYACLYASISKLPITSLTISFIASRYPKKLLEHLQRERCYTRTMLYSCPNQPRNIYCNRRHNSGTDNRQPETACGRKPVATKPEQ